MNLRQDLEEAQVEGVLLYPSADGEELRIDLPFPLHPVRVWSVDMSRHWQHVHQTLLELASGPLVESLKSPCILVKPGRTRGVTGRLTCQVECGRGINPSGIDPISP